MLNVTSGKIARAQKVVVYGAEGIGKSTFAAQFPNALFIDTEGGTAHMDIRRLEKPENWDDLISLVNEIPKQPDICRTLVLDTADWAEQLAVSHVCTKYKKTGLEDFGYGKGYTYLSEEFCRLLAAMNAVIAVGINVVVTAHAKMRKFEQPDEMGAYDRWEMKLSKQVAPLLKEWCDMLLFLNYKTFVVSTDNDKKKVQGGRRVIYTCHHACWDAKNRHGLAEELPLDFSGFASLFADAVAPAAPAAKKTAPHDTQHTASQPRETLARLILEAKVLPDEVCEVVAQKGHFKRNVPITQYPDAFISGWLIPCWEQIVKAIESKQNRLPF